MTVPLLLAMTDFLRTTLWTAPLIIAGIAALVLGIRKRDQDPRAAKLVLWGGVLILARFIVIGPIVSIFEAAFGFLLAFIFHLIAALVLVTGLLMLLNAAFPGKLEDEFPWFRDRIRKSRWLPPWRKTKP
jgi:hypothetical protein